jgi:hypothetical protein
MFPFDFDCAGLPCTFSVCVRYALDDNLYGKQVLDTIVELVFNKPGDDIAVIMAGYEAPIFHMIRYESRQAPLGLPSSLWLCFCFFAVGVCMLYRAPHTMAPKESCSAYTLWVDKSVLPLLSPPHTPLPCTIAAPMQDPEPWARASFQLHPSRPVRGLQRQ